MDYDENLISMVDIREVALRMLRSWLWRQFYDKSPFKNMYQTLKDMDMKWLLEECT